MSWKNVAGATARLRENGWILWRGITVLPKTAEIEALAAVYQKLLGIPDRAKTNCNHLEVCVLERIDYLLTWNCTHLGVIAQNKIYTYNEKNKLWIPVLLTPEAFHDIYEEEVI
jgi:hypothetical protein